MDHQWMGARWWKVDFHAHTPASADYGKGPKHEELRNRTPRDWLLDYMAAGIDCVAVTDHNSGSFIDPLKETLIELEAEKPDGYRPLVLFPGVEISVTGGIHVLGLFSPDKGTSDVDSVLGAVDFGGTKGTSDAVTSKSVPEVVAAINKAGGIAIPAHADGPSGLYRLTGTSLEQAVRCKGIVAVEVHHPGKPRPALIDAQTNQWTEVTGSDSHHPSGENGERFPGSHFTWVKMSRPSLEGLRLALLDGIISVQPHRDGFAPNAHSPLAIRGITVSKAKYIGQGAALVLPLSPWLTTIIGGRGSGKSTLVELVRLVLDRLDEIPDALKSDLGRYYRAYTDRTDSGLLTNETKVVIEYVKDGTPFRVTWNGGGHTIEQADDGGGWIQVEGDVRQRFPVRIYSQKQIFHLAKEPLALLTVIDEASPVEKKTWVAEWNQATNRYRSLRAKVRELEAALSEEESLRGELADVLRRLKEFEKAGHADVLKEYERRVRQRAAIDNWTGAWTDASDRVRAVADSLAAPPFPVELFEGEGEPEKVVREGIDRVHREFTSAQKDLTPIADRLTKAADNWFKVESESAWSKAENVAQQGYDALEAALDEAEAGEPKDFARLVARRQEIEDRLGKLETRRKEADSVRKQAEEVLEDVKGKRQLLTSKREAFLNDVLADNQHVRIDVLPYGASESAESQIRTLLKREGGGFDKDIGERRGGGMMGLLYPKNADGQCTEESLSTFKDTVSGLIRDRQTNYTAGDARFVQHLQKLSPEDLDSIDLWFPEDSLLVEYSPGADGKEFRPIESGSPGQMTAALLAFLLSYSRVPLILDQPEDDLDNELIYQLIVKQIRSAKTERQVLVVTHNPNIVVNGDAEFVAAMKATKGGSFVSRKGSLQERDVRDVICSIMEGGKQAFEQRYRRIALENLGV